MAKDTENKSFTTEFHWERDTKGTHVYAEKINNGPKKIGALYIQKGVFGAVVPADIEVTVKAR